MMLKIKKILIMLLSFVIALQAAGITAFADSAVTCSDETERSYTALINYALEGSELPQNGGIWVNNSSEEAFLSMLNGISSQNYSVNENGCIVQFITDESTVNEYDKKLKKLINGRKTIIISVSDVYMAYNNKVGEEYSVMLEYSDYALLFEKNSKMNVAVLNYYHYSEHPDECDSPEMLADEFLNLFFRDENIEHAAEQREERTEESAGYYSRASLPSVGLYRNFTSGIYGESGLGTDLKWYRIGKGPNKVFAVFAQHGWEDAWSSDGAELVKIADRVMSSLSSGNQNIFNDWTVYIIPYANPDGITDGYTNDGPGRCTVTTKIDMNRCWPSNFKPSYSGRNYTGPNSLGAPEAQQLKNFLSRNMGSYTNVVLDVHGWLNQTYGKTEVGRYFENEFGFKHKTKDSHGQGYLETWAYNQGAESCLVEFPMPKNSSSIVNNDFSGKFTDALVNMMYDFTGKIPVELNTVSGVPQSSRITGITANVKWNSVSMADGYQVQILSDSKGEWKVAGTTVTAEFNFKNLAFNHSYSVRVRPYRYSSRGIVYGDYWSHSCGFKTLDKASAAKRLGATDNVRTTAVTDNSIKIAFNPVSGANMYRIQWSNDSVNWKNAADIKNTEYILTDLSADSSYYIRVKAFAVSAGEIAESEKYSDIYHFFTMPKQVDLSMLPFSDLNNYKIYSAYVAYTSVYNKFISGTNPPEYTLFSPQTPITRAMMIAILYRMAGNPYDESNPYTENPFSDVAENAYYYNAACWALDNGITNQTAFKPNDNVTREQTARFLYAYAEINSLLGDEMYKNVKLEIYPDCKSVHNWAKEPLQWANYNGMITGTQQGYINPQGATQRIHATRILYGFGKTCKIGNFE